MRLIPPMSLLAVTLWLVPSCEADLVDPFPGGACAAPGGGPHHHCDVIGNRANFDIQGAAAEFTAQGAVFTLYFNYGNAFDGVQTLAPFQRFGITFHAGDLFFGPSEDYRFGVPLYSHDGFTAGSLYRIGEGIHARTAQDVLGYPRGPYRKNRLVWLGGSGSAIGSGAVSVSPYGNGISNAEFRVQVSLDRATSELLLAEGVSNGGLGLHFSSSTSGNDVIDGSLTVPEPGSWLLLTSVAIALLGRRLVPKGRASP